MICWSVGIRWIISVHRNFICNSQIPKTFFIFKIGFAAADSVTGLKLIEAGVKKESMAMLAVPLIPLQIILPLIISKFTAGLLTECLLSFSLHPPMNFSSTYQKLSSFCHVIKILHTFKPIPKTFYKHF